VSDPKSIDPTSIDLTSIDLTSIDKNRLIKAATAVRQSAYAPHSKFRVGASLQDELGRIHIGCNVENASFPQGTCAEANAIGAMVSAGGRRIVAIAVAGGRDSIEPCTPCGGCRQAIAEFADENTRILLQAGDGFDTCGIEELLPRSFRLD
jgi:cytidine deaminase